MHILSKKVLCIFCLRKFSCLYVLGFKFNTELPVRTAQPNSTNVLTSNTSGHTTYYTQHTNPQLTFVLYILSTLLNLIKFKSKISCFCHHSLSLTASLLFFQLNDRTCILFVVELQVCWRFLCDSFYHFLKIPDCTVFFGVEKDGCLLASDHKKHVHVLKVSEKEATIGFWVLLYLSRRQTNTKN